MTDHDVGGDAPCWAHLFEGDERRAPVVADLGSVDLSGRSGAVWSLPHEGDLDANLVHLNAGDRIEQHVNGEVDVLIFVQAGTAELTIDGVGYALRPDTVALVPKTTERRIVAGAGGAIYVTVHRRRGPLGVTPRQS
jgi:quercetin dioxygenase-like cupin family protein